MPTGCFESIKYGTSFGDGLANLVSAIRLALRSFFVSLGLYLMSISKDSSLEPFVLILVMMTGKSSSSSTLSLLILYLEEKTENLAKMD